MKGVASGQWFVVSAGASNRWPHRGVRNLFVSILSAIFGVLTYVSSTTAAEPTDEEKRVDAAIIKALQHLESRQLPSGAWAIDQFGESTAGTSLAVMAFMAAGHVPGEGPYDQAMHRGIRWVLDQQQQNGLLDRRAGHGSMYCHGISTLMLAEVVGMTDNDLADRCRESLKKAIKLILDSQRMRKDRSSVGGWRYQVESNDSDLSVTGWQLLALRAAKNLGCDVPAEQIDDAVEYVKRCSYRDRGFGYQPGGGPSPTRTGTGMLCLEICGVHHSRETLGGAAYLIQSPLRADQEWFYYGAYYCTIGLFQVGGDHWKDGKRHLIPLLLNMQSNDGSWLGNRGQERGMGTVYATSLAVLALSVEYQYLPIYQR